MSWQRGERWTRSCASKRTNDVAMGRGTRTRASTRRNGDWSTCRQTTADSSSRTFRSGRSGGLWPSTGTEGHGRRLEPHARRSSPLTPALSPSMCCGESPPKWRTCVRNTCWGRGSIRSPTFYQRRVGVRGRTGERVSISNGRGDDVVPRVFSSHQAGGELVSTHGDFVIGCRA